MSTPKARRPQMRGCYGRFLRLAARPPFAGRLGVGFVLFWKRQPGLIPGRGGPPIQKSSTVGGSSSRAGAGTANSGHTGTGTADSGHTGAGAGTADLGHAGAGAGGTGADGAIHPLSGRGHPPSGSWEMWMAPNAAHRGPLSGASIG